MSEVMIDLETLGTQSNAVILTIGAIKFNRNSGHQELKNMNTFYRQISIDSCVELNMYICENTLNWWKKQDKEIYKEAFEGDRIPIKQVLTEFITWIGKPEYVWCQGTSFDFPILENALKKCNIPIPWKFWNQRDSRTLCEVLGVKKPQNLAHNSLRDCYNQIYAVKEAIKILENKISK